MGISPAKRAASTAERSRNPQGEGIRLREELIAAAGRLLAKDANPAALSLRAVAREAGVSAPSTYLHFESKDALLHAVVVEHFATFQRAVEKGMASAADPVSCLYAGCLAYCRFAIEQPGAYRIIFESSLPSGAGYAGEERPGIDAFQVLVDGVARCIAAGVARPADPFEVAIDIWTSMHGMVSLRQHLTRFPWPSIDHQLASMLAAHTGIDREALN